MNHQSWIKVWSNSRRRGDHLVIWRIRGQHGWLNLFWLFFFRPSRTIGFLLNFIQKKSIQLGSNKLGTIAPELLATEPHIFAPCLSENQFRADRSEFNEFEVLVWVMLLRNSNKNSAFYRLPIENCPVLFEFQAHSEAGGPLETVSTAKKQLHSSSSSWHVERHLREREG